MRAWSLCLSLYLDEWIAAVSTLAGGVGGTNSRWADATGTSAGFNEPVGVAVDSSGNVYVADYFNSRIRKVTPLGGTQLSHFFRFLLCHSSILMVEGPMHCACLFFVWIVVDG
jgi:hypothetical protein